MKRIYFLVLVLSCCNGLMAQVINFPDANFKSKLLSATTSNDIAHDIDGNRIKIDTNNNGEIEMSEAATVSWLWFNGNLITSIVGVTSFQNLKRLTCSSNRITNLDVSGMTSLVQLECSGNRLTSLNVTGLINLEKLDCSGNSIGTITDNQLTTLDVSTLNNLKELDCQYNKITALDCSGLTQLEKIDCTRNLLTSLNVQGDLMLQQMQCDQNQLSQLDLSNLPALTLVWCQYNQLEELNFNGTNELGSLRCNSNQIRSLDLNNTKVSILDCSYNSNLSSLSIKNNMSMSTILASSFSASLRYICCDPSELDYFQTNVLGVNPNCSISTNCAFSDTAHPYTMNGNIRIDRNNNGCDLSDTGYPNMKFKINDTNDYLIVGTAGLYTFAVPDGSYTLTPELENTSYFNISPAFVSGDFPTQSSPLSQDFCVIPNGIHPDLEIAIIPMGIVRPGFDAFYRLIYKNKGNQVLSGSITFAFDDARMNFLTSSTAVSSQILNSLEWNFSDLLPFERHEIDLRFSMNSPLDTPPLNSGDIINFTAVIEPSVADEYPDDNIAQLYQRIVNSFDPNDKTCLEGETITPEMLGKDLHYMIRFENTGTANAEKVVVRDIIDSQYFFESTLVPIAGSHPFRTQITNSNKVEFIFDNINLPFDDANNDGYVAFKIKTLPFLQVGDLITNTASIYFDYNTPIVTNTATTEVALLASHDFEFEDYFSIHPNPVKDILNIETKHTIEITSINIYNILGQLVLVIPNAQQTKSVDVSSLKTGNYFIKVNSDKGSSSVKFVKM